MSDKEGAPRPKPDEPSFIFEATLAKKKEILKECFNFLNAQTSGQGNKRMFTLVTVASLSVWLILAKALGTFKFPCKLRTDKALVHVLKKNGLHSHLVFGCLSNNLTYPSPTWHDWTCSVFLCRQAAEKLFWYFVAIKFVFLAKFSWYTLYGHTVNTKVESIVLDFRLGKTF